ncbi:unnamed protein product [Musa banksii]
MLPHTTLKLKVIGYPNLRPTLTCKIHEYALAADIIRSQSHPSCPKELFSNSPLVTDILYYIIIAVGLAIVQKVKLMKNRQLSLASELDRGNRASTQSAVRLQEIGPRMTLHLVKV